MGRSTGMIIVAIIVIVIVIVWIEGCWIESVWVRMGIGIFIGMRMRRWIVAVGCASLLRNDLVR